MFECFITNLPRDEFNADAIKELYRMRWGIETSFRELKHTIGLLYFHSKKEEFIIQEIYAGLILYNYCQMITSHVTLQHNERTYEYQLNSIQWQLSFAVWRQTVSLYGLIVTLYTLVIYVINIRVF